MVVSDAAVSKSSENLSRQIKKKLMIMGKFLEISIHFRKQRLTLGPFLIISIFMYLFIYWVTQESYKF